LENVVTSEIFRSSTERNLRLEDLETNFAPLSDGLQSNTTVDERMCEFTTMSPEGVCSDHQRSRSFVGIEEGEGFLWGKKPPELLSQET